MIVEFFCVSLRVKIIHTLQKPLSSVLVFIVI
jgi:hypothetical protein